MRACPTEIVGGVVVLQETVSCSTAGCTATASFTDFLSAGATVVSATLTTLVRHIDAAGAANFVTVRAYVLAAVGDARVHRHALTRF